MAQMVELNLRPNEKTLRQFGWIALFGFGFVALLAWRGWLIFAAVPEVARDEFAVAFAALAVASATFSLVWPKANWPIYVGLTIVAFPIGFVLSYVIMATLFYVIIAPIGFLMRLFGHDPMHRHFDRNAKSYWLDARPPRPSPSYFKQF
jgi:hypothetical protein